MANTIPRLAADAKPLSVTINVNAKLAPYFKAWFQRKKLDGETAEQFALRYLKQSAMNDYLADTGKTARDVIQAETDDKIFQLNAEAATMLEEVDA